MKKNIISIYVILLLLFIIAVSKINAQSVGISATGSSPDSKAMLDVSSSNKGVLIPRMTQAERDAITSPTTSLLIYQSDNTPGYYYWNGTSWNRMKVSSDAGDNLGNHTATGAIAMQNFNITGVNNVNFNDPGEDEGIIWSGAAAKLFVSPLNGGDSDGYLRLINDGGIVFEPGVQNSEAMILTASGDVGIGTTTPSYKLHVVGKLKSDGVTETSDQRLKEHVKTIEGALEKVEALRGVYFDWKPEFNMDSTLQLGVIAQETELIVPEVVNTDGEGYKSVEYAKLVALLIEAIKEQNKSIKKQQNQWGQSLKEIRSIRAELDGIKETMNLLETVEQGQSNSLKR